MWDWWNAAIFRVRRICVALSRQLPLTIIQDHTVYRHSAVRLLEGPPKFRRSSTSHTKSSSSSTPPKTVPKTQVFGTFNTSFSTPRGLLRRLLRRRRSAAGPRRPPRPWPGRGSGGKSSRLSWKRRQGFGISRAGVVAPVVGGGTGALLSQWLLAP